MLKCDNPESIFGPTESHDLVAGWAGDFLEVQLVSDLGKKRQNNEDACMLHVPESESQFEARGILIAVADGMGGASAGEHASHKTLECIQEKYFDTSTHSLIPSALKHAVEAANAVVFEESEQNPAYTGMGTTVSVLAVMGEWAYIAQVGDSRIYLLRPGETLKQLTNDHSLVAEQIRNGLINEEEARNHSLKNLITRAVGIKDTVEVDLFAVRLQEGDRLLLCSDGLSNMVEDDMIAACLDGDNLKKSTEELVQCALAAGGHDNITAVTALVTAAPPTTHYQQGARIVSFNPPGLLQKLWRIFER